ncbi:hypothetical protein N7537_006587 [Penicillium hordei]|uniref:Uncharacterized protein n=1 Tax=Penicillium hordei TaxID=40994 RepID=A0AAD6E8B6_9EURO|nr:uncharacterized protein N7537_006587 [Penicillium hordei]KAJ5603631.1 hypothetical protein N7537_006587 [Penicillium hordei]
MPFFSNNPEYALDSSSHSQFSIAGTRIQTPMPSRMATSYQNEDKSEFEVKGHSKWTFLPVEREVTTLQRALLEQT